MLTIVSIMLSANIILFLRKKLKKLEGAWAVNKDLLGWTFDGIAKTIELDEAKLPDLLATLKAWCRATAVPFDDFRKTVSKVQNATIGVPAARGLFTDINKVIRKAPRTVYVQRNKPVLAAVRGF